MEAWLDTVHLLKYGEKVELGCGVTVMAASAGNGLGSCNWRLWGPSGTPSVCIVTAGNRNASGEAPLDHMALSGCDSLYFPHLHPRASPGSSLAEVCHATAAVVEGGGCVLIPLTPESRVVEMVEALCQRLPSMPPLLYISPVATELAAALRAMPEWVAAPRLAQVPSPLHLSPTPLPCPLTRPMEVQLYQQQPVWRHVEAQESGRVCFSPSLHSAFRGGLPSPCVLLVPSHSMAVGPAAHALHTWHHSTRCTLIFTATGPPPEAALRPWRRDGVQTLHLPMHAHLRYRLRHEGGGAIADKRFWAVWCSVSEAVELAVGLKVGHVTVPDWAHPAFAAIPLSSSPGLGAVDLCSFEEVPPSAASVATASSLRCRVAIPNGRPVVGECSVGGCLWSPLVLTDLMSALRERGLECSAPEQLPGGECRLGVGGGALSGVAALVLREKWSSVSAQTAGDREMLSHILTPLLKRPL